MEQNARSPRALIYTLYALSGLVSLVYQVAWFRIFVDRFGSTNLTFVLVVTNFIGGLGIGALLSERVSSRISKRLGGASHLRVYGVLELAVSATALLTLALGALPADLWGAFPYELRDGIYEQTLAYRLSRGVIVSICVLLPCLFMGMTFPLLCAAFGDEERFPSALYGWNTLGACAGILAFEFLLMPALGHTRSFQVAVAVNAGIGVFFAGLAPASIAGWRRVAPLSRESDGSTLGSVSVLVTCAVVGGLVTGVIEADVFKHIRYTNFRSAAAMPLISFWAILAIFVASWTVRVVPRISLRTAAILYVVAVLYYAIVWRYAIPLDDAILAWQSEGVSTEALASDQAYILGLYVRYSGPGGLLLFLGLTIFPPFYLFSLLLPAVCNRLQGAREHLGRAYGLNTVAFCIGMVTFTWIAPRVDAFYAFKLATIVLTAATALLLALRESESPVARWKPAGAAGLVLVGCAVVPRGFDPAFFPPNSPAVTGHVRALRSNGDTTTFVVTDLEGDSSLFFDNFNMSGTGIVGQRYMRLMSHFPLLAQPNPKTAAVICFGVGNTASAIARHDSIEELDIIDLNDQVFRTAPEFSATNDRVYEDPRVRLIHDDGRNFLALTDRRYDLITSEPPPPLYEGVYRLYSAEYYADVAERLTPTGMMTQWLPTRQMPNESIQLAITSFIEAFPHALLFVGHRHDFILLGSMAPIDLHTLERRFEEASPALRDELARLYVFQPINLLARIVKSDEQLREEYGGLPVISDERRDWAYARFDPAHPPQITYDPVQLLRHVGASGLDNRAIFSRAVTHAGLLRSYVQDFPLNTLTGITGESVGRVLMADVDWNRIYDLNAHAHELSEAGKRHEAIALYGESLELADEQMHILQTVGLLQSDVLDYTAAAETWRRFIRIMPDRPDGYLRLGEALAELGRNDEAVEAWNAASDRAPTDLTVQRALGWAFFEIGEWEASIAALERALSAAPSEVEARDIERKLAEARSRARDGGPTASQPEPDAAGKSG